ncbi:MAG: hypothetical protein WCC52_02725 [Nitrosotalea sp.]
MIIIIALSFFYSSFMLVPHVFAEQALGSFNFDKVITDNEGKKYIIGEIQNTDPNDNIESEIYFSKSDLQSAYYTQYVGIIGHGMAMPFKIYLSNDTGENFTLSDMKISSQTTLQQPYDSLQINYNSLHMDPSTNAMTGFLHNTSHDDFFGIKVLAIAMDAHAKVLDVTESDLIPQISSNDSVSFTLVPIDSISKDVFYYSCYIPGGPETQNYSLPAENGQNISFEIQSDGKIKDVNYDQSTHSITFRARGDFVMGGWVGLMITTEPDSYLKSDSLSATVGGTTPFREVSSSEIISGKTYKHISLDFPVGYSNVSITPVIATPEFPFPLLVMAGTFFFTMIFFYKHRVS